jgi:histidinol phosphatase-like enzyme (inositol monophosphatase family)
MSRVAEYWKPRLQFALDVARRAGELILGHYQSDGLAVDAKHDSSPVTAADRGAEELIRRAVATEFPGDGVLGEEFGELAGSNGLRWILDPVDGTKSFIHGVPLFGTLIGLEADGRVVLGVCRFPALGEVVYAAKGLGAWWQVDSALPRPARVSAVDRLSEALFCVTTISGWERIGRYETFEALRSRCKLTRGWGDCYGHALVATGRADVMVDPLMNVWDAAALLPILEEAGGHFVDWEGRPAIDSGNGVSVNHALRDEVLEILAQNATRPSSAE